MNPYPEESQSMDFIGHLEELRRRILVCLGFLAAASAVLLVMGRSLMVWVKRPLEGAAAEMIFISPAEAFTAYVKLALFGGLILTVPVIFYESWLFLYPAVPRPKRKNILIWIGVGSVLFLAGLLFSFFVAIPTALRFLLSFGAEFARPAITLGKYVSFFGALMIIGGAIFEIPIVMGLLADIGVLRTDVLKAKRQYALIIILIVAAVITPTQDVFNMFLFALPMGVLYELGVFLARMIEKRKNKTLTQL
ncbi:MAG: twin-arginine translocase subunit TatC [Candidatus Omnitrophica bacterium]|nr:twin-arginine translocase subunit TatC [Candidatus Omnitrophota bacterium]